MCMRAGRSSLPLFTPASWSGPNKPRTRTVNSLGSRWMARCSFAASAPSEVTSSSPPSMPGMGLTAMKRRPAVLGRRSISAARSAVDSRSGSPGERLKRNTCAAAAARVLDRASVEADVIGRGDFLAELGDAPVDGEPLRADPFLHAAARCEAALREIFLQPLGDAGGRRTRAWHGKSLVPAPSGLVGRRRRHQAGGGIARRGQFLVVGVVIRGGIELVGVVLDRGHQRHLGADRQLRPTAAAAPPPSTAPPRFRTAATAGSDR